MRVDLQSRTVRPQAGSSDGSPCWSYPNQCSRDYLRNQGQSVSPASYDHRMTTAARALAMPVYDLEPS